MKKIASLALVLALTPLLVRAQECQGCGEGEREARRAVNPPNISPLVPAYSIAIRHENMIFVSSMTGFKPGTQDIVEGGAGAQTRQTLENIRTSLRTAGAAMSDVGECTVFLVDMADYATMNKADIEFFPKDPPARATLAVSGFPRAAARVENKCSAVIQRRSVSAEAAVKIGATIDHVTLHVQDFARSVEFYTSILGLERIQDPFKDDRHAFFRLGSQTELHILGGRKKPADDDIDVHFALRVPSIPEFRRHLERVGVKSYSTRRELGATTTRPDGVLQVYLQDADGYWIEVNDRKP